MCFKFSDNYFIENFYWILLVALYKMFDIFLLWNHWLDWVRINFRSIQWANSTLFNIHEIFQNGSEFQWSKFPILWIWRRAADLQTIFRKDLQSSILKEIIPCMLLLAKVFFFFYWPTKKQKLTIESNQQNCMMTTWRFLYQILR